MTARKKLETYKFLPEQIEDIFGLENVSIEYKRVEGHYGQIVVVRFDSINGVDTVSMRPREDNDLSGNSMAIAELFNLSLELDGNKVFKKGKNND